MSRVSSRELLELYIRQKLDLMAQEAEMIRLLKEMLNDGEIDILDPLVDKVVAQLMRWDKMI